MAKHKSVKKLFLQTINQRQEELILPVKYHTTAIDVINELDFDKLYVQNIHSMGNGRYVIEYLEKDIRNSV